MGATSVVTEAALKLIAFGVRGYFKQRWNVFDFCLVLGAYVGFASSLPSIATLLRVFRVLRVVRLARGSKAMLQVRGLRRQRTYPCLLYAVLSPKSAAMSLSVVLGEHSLTWWLLFPSAPLLREVPFLLYRCVAPIERRVVPHVVPRLRVCLPSC